MRTALIPEGYDSTGLSPAIGRFPEENTELATPLLVLGLGIETDPWQFRNVLVH